MKKLKTGDQVVVTTGRDKGREGKVERVLADGRLIVGDINMIKKHVRQDPQRGVTGGIVQREAPIQRSNVMLLNPATGKGDRVGIRVNDEGQRERYFKSNGEPVKG